MITCYNPNTYCRWDSNQDGSDDNILNLSQDEIMKLPNIGEVVDFYHSVENNFINAGRWNSLNLNMPSIDMFKQLGLNRTSRTDRFYIEARIHSINQLSQVLTEVRKKKN